MSYSNARVTTIFLDAGGILFDTPIKGEARVRKLMIQRGYPISEINSAIKKAKQIKPPFVSSWTEEKQYYEQFYGKIAEELGDVKLTDELFYLAHYATNCELFPEVKRVLEELSKSYRLAVISNAMPSMDWVFDDLEIRKYFDSIILSAFVKEEKPSPAIYHIALQKMKAHKDECLFIDDKLENVKGAERVGIKSFLLDREKQNLYDLLKENGVDVT